MSPFLPLDVREVRGCYLHVPFCEHKCGYCDFFSTAHHELAEAVIARLCEELAALERQAERLRTVFIGGGTPTVLAPALLERLLDAVRRATARSSIEEWSVEANPGSLDATKARLLAQAGVTRVSLGAQSFRAEHLRLLERVHEVEDIFSALDLIADAGIARRSIDLMFALPGQTRASWRADLRRACSLDVEHLSAYCLTMEPGTAFAARHRQGALTLPEGDEAADFLTDTWELTEAAGLRRYEISNFARHDADDDTRCRHNVDVWQGEDYLGLGPGAVSRLGPWRMRRTRDLAKYASGRVEGRFDEEERLSDAQQALELLMMGLRMSEGLPWRAWEARLGQGWRALAPWQAIARLEGQGLLVSDAQALRCTERGFFTLDALLRALARAIGDDATARERSSAPL